MNNIQGTYKKILLLVICIIICAIGARLLNSGETLSEYAQKHPEAAYSSTTQNSSENANQ
ncbi:hypothetical protein SAMN02745229_02611 [Butyrivibrio fibrisolvens DSM 3071]|jgi:hypothetical protein|uniref:Uncharacterized protein n=1 Tax=Butyrivibrio fibrisolvens DSM 3071 TaxID=1121131 RepID=A0A1M5ZS87_BUTFI|nr:hypothetical protein [Butyrivibrio fibrisolvens]SHI27167.1 hypothetical protein SAMN02745229_02611 [Butyrivibrio fibrisolvens DSM 3071]